MQAGDFKSILKLLECFPLVIANSTLSNIRRQNFWSSKTNVDEFERISTEIIRLA